MKKIFPFIISILFITSHYSAYSQCANQSNIYSFVYNGKTYEVIKETKTWSNASACAVSRGGILAEIDDLAEQNAIFSELNSNAGITVNNTVAPDGGGGAYVWIGGNDLAIEGNWVWDGNNDNNSTQFWLGTSTGSPVGGLYNNWGNEPDDFNGQDALGLSLNGWPLGASGQWNDVDHNNTLYSIIEHSTILCTPTSSTDTQTACDSYTWIDGNIYTSSNSTTAYTLTNAAGCDSVITLNLTINNVSDLTTTTSGATITANNTNASYQWLFCDNGNTIINSENGQSFTASANGNYAVELTENGCIDTTVCINISLINTGILENSFGNNILVYPNPTSGNFHIDLGSIYESSEVVITDISGKLIDSKNITQSKILDLSIEKPVGVYIIYIQAGDKKAVLKLVKE